MFLSMMSSWNQEWFITGLLFRKVLTFEFNFLSTIARALGKPPHLMPIGYMRQVDRINIVIHRNFAQRLSETQARNRTDGCLLSLSMDPRILMQWESKKFKNYQVQHFKQAILCRVGYQLFSVRPHVLSYQRCYYKLISMKEDAKVSVTR